MGSRRCPLVLPGTKQVSGLAQPAGKPGAPLPPLRVTAPEAEAEPCSLGADDWLLQMPERRRRRVAASNGPHASSQGGGDNGGNLARSGAWAARALCPGRLPSLGPPPSPGRNPAAAALGTAAADLLWAPSSEGLRFLLAMTPSVCDAHFGAVAGGLSSRQPTAVLTRTAWGLFSSSANGSSTRKRHRLCRQRPPGDRHQHCVPTRAQSSTSPRPGRARCEPQPSSSWGPHRHARPLFLTILALRRPNVCGVDRPWRRCARQLGRCPPCASGCVTPALCGGLLSATLCLVVITTQLPLRGSGRADFGPPSTAGPG